MNAGPLTFTEMVEIKLLKFRMNIFSNYKNLETHTKWRLTCCKCNVMINVILNCIDQRNCKLFLSYCKTQIKVKWVKNILHPK